MRLSPVLILLFIAPLSASVEAQKQPSEEAAFRTLVENEARALHIPEQKDIEARELVAMVLMVRLKKAMDLTDEQTLKLVQDVGKYKDQLHQMKWQIGSSRQELRLALKSGASDAAIEQMLEGLLMQEEAIAELISTLVTEAQKDVSVAQAAKLYLFVDDFEQDMRRLIYRAQQAIKNQRFTSANPARKSPTAAENASNN